MAYQTAELNMYPSRIFGYANRERDFFVHFSVGKDITFTGFFLLGQKYAYLAFLFSAAKTQKMYIP